VVKRAVGGVRVFAVPAREVQAMLAAAVCDGMQRPPFVFEQSLFHAAHPRGEKRFSR